MSELENERLVAIEERLERLENIVTALSEASKLLRTIMDLDKSAMLLDLYKLTGNEDYSKRGKELSKEVAGRLKEV